MKKQLLTKFTLWTNRLIAVIMVVLAIFLWPVLDWYCSHRVLAPIERTAITYGFYACAVFVLLALWHIDALLRSILRQEVFTRKNVRHIRYIQWCCAIVGLICIPAGLCYYPLLFLAVIMGFLCLVVSVVTRVMDAAVSIREENDLTI